MSPRTAWLVLFVAGLFEAGWAVGLEYSDGLTNAKPTVALLVSMAISVVLLAKAVETLPVGTAYAVWTGIGAVSTAIAGMYLFDEPATLARLFFVAVVVAGVAGLQFVSSA
ncbi:MAG: multidrug efflux SMR transporter [Halosimplex sp.]